MTSDIRQQAVELRKQGLSFTQIAKQLGISRATAYRYAKSVHTTKETNQETINETTNETTDETNETVETKITETETNTNVDNLLEKGHTDLKVVSANDVVEDINKRITIIKTKGEEKEKEKKDIKESLKEKVSSNKYMIALIIIAILGASIGLYTFFRHRKSKNSSNKDKNKTNAEAKEITEEGIKEKQLPVVTPYGYVEEKLNQKGNVAIL